MSVSPLSDNVFTRNEPQHNLVTDFHDTSALGEGFDATPMVVPVRGHLDSIKRLLMGDRYIGRGSAISWQEPLLQYVESIAVWSISCNIEFP